jgi:hypothetical protein
VSNDTYAMASYGAAIGFFPSFDNQATSDTQSVREPFGTVFLYQRTTINIATHLYDRQLCHVHGAVTVSCRVFKANSPEYFFYECSPRVETILQDPADLARNLQGRRRVVSIRDGRK